MGFPQGSEAIKVVSQLAVVFYREAVRDYSPGRRRYSYRAPHVVVGEAKKPAATQDFGELQSSRFAKSGALALGRG
jgi:hypothetical protein